MNTDKSNSDYYEYIFVSVQRFTRTRHLKQPKQILYSRCDSWIYDVGHTVYIILPIPYGLGGAQQTFPFFEEQWPAVVNEEISKLWDARKISAQTLPNFAYIQCIDRWK